MLKEKKRKWQGLKSLCLLMLCCLLLSGCRAETAKVETAQRKQGAKEALDVWFFACSEDADSILLQTKEADILIDTGIEEDSARLLDKLHGLEVDDIELLILTHPDKDHIGGAVSLLEKFPVAQIILTDCEKGSELQDELQKKLQEELGAGKAMIPESVTELTFDKLLLTVYPPQEAEYKNSNNYSIGVLAEYEGKKFFFAGDAKKKRIKELLEEDLPKVDVYKLAHHGRDNEASDELILQLRPQYAVVTAEGAEEKTKKALDQVGARLFSTYEKDVHFSVKDGVLDVR